MCVDATLTGTVNLEHGSRVSVTFVQKTVNPKTHQPVSLFVYNYDNLFYVVYALPIQLQLAQTPMKQNIFSCFIIEPR